MAEHIPKTDEEIDWEEIVNNAEKQDSKWRKKRSLLKINIDWLVENRLQFATGIIIFVALTALSLHVFLTLPIWDTSSNP